MQIQLSEGSVSQIVTDVLVVPLHEKDPRDPQVNAWLDEATAGWVEEVYASGDFSGRLLETITLHRPSGLEAKRLMLVGAGDAKKFTPFELRRLAGAVVRQLRSKNPRQVTFALQSPTPESAAALVEGAILGEFEPEHLKSKKEDKRIAKFTIAVPDGAAELETATARAQIVAEAQNWGRELTNAPSNILPPPVLVDRAREMAAQFGLDCEVLDEPRMRQLGMGALLGVAMGSDQPPALIILRYVPESAAGADHLALIGKAVTFDSGGISIKPADGMEKMKYDMGGGASVLAAMRAIAQLKPNLRITAFVPTVENMINGRAQRPGDIVTTLNGKTVEVLNTDAEGRLILIDAITYAIRQGCTHLVNAATLTGAIVVALGNVHIGAFTNDESFLARVQEAGKAAGDRMWHMPLDDEYKEYLKSAFADLPNIGGRWGGAITAAYFLKEFTEDKPWVHLDIAGTAWLDDAKPYMAKGPTGLPARTFVNLAMNWP